MFNIYERESYYRYRNDKVDFGEGLPEIDHVRQFMGEPHRTQRRWIVVSRRRETE